MGYLWILGKLAQELNEMRKNVSGIYVDKNVPGELNGIPNTKGDVNYYLKINVSDYKFYRFLSLILQTLLTSGVNEPILVLVISGSSILWATLLLLV